MYIEILSVCYLYIDSWLHCLILVLLTSVLG